MKIFSFIFLFSFAFCSCHYNVMNDRSVVERRDVFDSSDKFIFTVYYNSPSIYWDTPPSPYEIRDICHELKKTQVFYKDDLPKFLELIFEKRPKVIQYGNRLAERPIYHTVCDIRNQKGDTLLWFSYDDPEKGEPTMILNGNLTETNEKLMVFVKTMLQPDAYFDGAEPEEPENGSEFRTLKSEISRIANNLTDEQKLELVRLILEQKN